jgi:hypothetical protein
MLDRVLFGQFKIVREVIHRIVPSRDGRPRNEMLLKALETGEAHSTARTSFCRAGYDKGKSRESSELRETCALEFTLGELSSSDEPKNRMNMFTDSLKARRS